MELRTEVRIPSQPLQISYSTPVMFIGSCFAGEMAGKMKEGLMPALSNPSGVVYNPFSVAMTLRNVISGRIFTEEDLWHHNKKWLSFAHYTLFSTSGREECLEKINRSGREATDFLRKASFLFVTFGTARIYRRKDTGEIVSNCHRIPSSFFERAMPGPAEIADDWNLLLEELYRFNPKLSVIFTISPVRHWKDGAHGNQVSKSTLFLAVEELQKHRLAPGYFPSYEIVMDDLRDYRFYGDDMLHPSSMAVDYIWGKFTAAWFDRKTDELWREISALSRAAGHNITGSAPDDVIEFASSMLRRMERIEKGNPGIDFSALRSHFLKLSET